MRPNNNQRRGRGRAGRRPNIPARAQTYDSNGPGGRIRGNATQVYEKYAALARDAMAAGDRVLAEGLHQYAEHYYRIINDSTDPEPTRPPAPPREEGEAAQEAPKDAADGAEAAAAKPDASPVPAAPVSGAQEESSASSRRPRRRPRAPMGESGDTEGAPPRQAERSETAASDASESETSPAEDEGLRKMLSASASPQAEEKPSRRRKANGAAQTADSEAEITAADEQPEATPESV